MIDFYNAIFNFVLSAKIAPFSTCVFIPNRGRAWFISSVFANTWQLSLFSFVKEFFLIVHFLVPLYCFNMCILNNDGIYKYAILSSHSRFLNKERFLFVTKLFIDT